MKRQGKRFLLAGILVALAPVVLAIIGAMTSGSSMFDEGSGGGAALWLLFFSIPIGFLLTVIGIVRWLFVKRG